MGSFLYDHPSTGGLLTLTIVRSSLTQVVRLFLFLKDRCHYPPYRTLSFKIFAWSLTIAIS